LLGSKSFTTYKTKGLKSDTISATGGGTTIDSTTDLSCNTLTTVGNATIGGILTVGSETLDNKISNAITGKQNSITARNNLTITNDVLDVDEDVVTNSLVIRPSFLKESYTPSVAGEIRATTLTIDDYVNGVVYDVKDTLIGKQEKLENTSNLNIKSLNVLSDFGAIIVETAGQIACDILSSGTLSTNGDASIGGKLTAPSGNIETFTAYTLNAFSCTLDTFNAQFINLVGNLDMTGTLTIGGETLDSKLNGKQDTLTAGSGITIDASNVISSTGGTAERLGDQVFYALSTSSSTCHISPFNIVTKRNTELYSFDGNAITILKSGYYKVSFNCNFHNIGYLDRANIKTTVLINGNGDITLGGQATCYIRHSDYADRGTTSNSLFYNLDAGDIIQLENRLIKRQQMVIHLVLIVSITSQMAVIS